MFEGRYVRSRGGQLVALTIIAICAGCAGATDEPGEPPADHGHTVVVGSSGKADSLNDRDCSYERDGIDHQDYCRGLGPGGGTEVGYTCE